MSVEEVGGIFRISGSGLSYEVPANLVGFLGSLIHERKDFLRKGSPGFWLKTSGEKELACPPLRGSITRQGPLAVGLRFIGHWPVEKGADVPVVIELTFPSSKSWVEVCWTVDDSRDGRVIELGLDLDLAIEGATTLVELRSRCDSLRNHQR